MTRLSCSEFSFPAVSEQERRIGIVAALGFTLCDVGLMLEDDGRLLADEQAVADSLSSGLRAAGLSAADLFFAVGSTFEEIALNPPDSELAARRLEAFSAAARVTAAIGAPGITILPGVVWPGDPGSWVRCVDGLRRRVELAAGCGIELRVEAHAGAIAALPESALELVGAVPGLRLTLDVSHFELQSVAAPRWHPLAEHTGHVHVRAAKPGAIQVPWAQNETDFSSLLEVLRAAGYEGAFCIEYVPMRQWRCDELDVITETLATRDGLQLLGVT
ncbi:MAG: sugar phosphate isomerase/epimerase family protein [Gaiella sp.]